MWNSYAIARIDKISWELSKWSFGGIHRQPLCQNSSSLSLSIAFRLFAFSFQVKRDMVAIKHELDTVQQVKEEIEELREYVDRLEEHTHRRKLRLLEQVSDCIISSVVFFTVFFRVFLEMCFQHFHFVLDLHVFAHEFLIFLNKNEAVFRWKCLDWFFFSIFFSCFDSTTCDISCEFVIHLQFIFSLSTQLKWNWWWIRNSN